MLEWIFIHYRPFMLACRYRISYKALTELQQVAQFILGNVFLQNNMKSTEI